MMNHGRQLIQPADLKPVSVSEVQGALGIDLDEQGLPLLPGMARLVRLAAHRWRVTQKRELTGYLSQLLDALELAPEMDRDEVRGRAREVVEGLISLRELEALETAGRRVLIPALPRLVRCSEERAFFLGEDDLSVKTEGLPGASGVSTLTRWVSLHESVSQLEAAGVRSWALSDWLGEPGYRTHLRRRAPELTMPILSDLWQIVTASLESEASSLGEDSMDCWVFTGLPGEFSGAPMKTAGRWRPADGAPDGLWCGKRSGHGSRQLSSLIEIKGGKPARLIDLFSNDELDWLLLSRACALGQPELLTAEGDILRQTTFLPAQLLRALRLLCVREQGWRWRTWPSVAQPLAEALSSLGGLRLSAS